MSFPVRFRHPFDFFYGAVLRCGCEIRLHDPQNRWAKTAPAESHSARREQPLLCPNLEQRQRSLEVAQDILFSVAEARLSKFKNEPRGRMDSDQAVQDRPFRKGNGVNRRPRTLPPGKMRWDMWLRLFDYVVMAAVLLLVVWVPVILVLKLAGPAAILPPDASAGDAWVAWGRDGTR